MHRSISSSSSCRVVGGGATAARARPPVPPSALTGATGRQAGRQAGLKRRRRRPSLHSPPPPLAAATTTAAEAASGDAGDSPPLSSSENDAAAAQAAAALSQQQQQKQKQQRLAYSRDTLKRMAAFCGPALIVPMAEPLMGFTDVVCVGQFASSTAELSALGPATLALSFCTYAWQACQVATLSLCSERLRARDHAGAQRALSAALWLALAAGSAVAIPMVLVPGAAAAVVSATGCDAALAPLAETYVRIRSAGLPFVLATMVGQAGLLAQRDSRTPAAAVALGVVVNVVGNLVAVAWLGFGLAGAAATTVLTQAAGAAALSRLMWRGGVGSGGAGGGSGSSAEEGSGGEEQDDEDGNAAPPTPAAAAGAPPPPPLPPLLPIPRLPALADAKAMGSTVGPLSVAYVCRNLCYLALQGAAASLDVTRLAAHQATFSCWNILAFVSAPVEQSALAFVPAAAAAAREDDEEEEEQQQKEREEEERREEGEEEGEAGGRPAAAAAADASALPPSSSLIASSSSSWWRVAATVRLVLLCGLAMGVGCGTLAALIPTLVPSLFTPDAAVWPHMRSVAPQAFLSMVLIGLDVACAGCLLAGRNFAFVARSYVVTLAVLWAAVLGPWKLASTLGGVWWCLVLFFAARALQSSARLAALMRRRGLMAGGGPVAASAAA
jgi:Na+-driven multidrug efflux pump